MMKQCIVFTGLPGTGKSSIAEAVSRQLSIPIFAKDWLEATLLRCGWEQVGVGVKPIGYVGYALLTTLAERQLRLTQSVILDSVASTNEIRNEWRDLAQHYDAQRLVVECICSDKDLHRARLAVRQRNISGWEELTWDEVERVQSYYVPWDEKRLVLDAVNDLNANIKQAIEYLQEGTISRSK
jgi:predicted kinase